MSSKVSVSVIVPVYNSEKYLSRCLDSLLSQTLDNFEVIIVNDGSTDNSPALCDQYAAIDKRIKVIHKNNGGVGSARREGISNARGEYSIHVDSDDWAEPGMLKEMYEAALRDDSDLVAADYFIYEKYIECPAIPGNPKDLISAILQRRYPPFLWHKLIRHSLYTDYSVNFKDGINFGEDAFVISQLLLYAKKITSLPKAFYHYGDNPGSITRSRFKMAHFESRIRWVRELEVILAGYPAQLESLMHMKVFIKRSMADSGLFTQDEFDNTFPECKPYLSQVNLLPLRKMLLKLPFCGHLRTYRRLENLKPFFKRIYLGLRPLKKSHSCPAK